MNHLDLFSGIGGFSLAASWVWGDEHNIVSFVEIDRGCQKILLKNFPGVPIVSDIRDYNHDGSHVDLLTGGFPCQDISIANPNPKGICGERSGLWSEMHRLIRDIRPRRAIVENVPAITVRGIGQVLGGLAQIGYDAEWDMLPASLVGAPQKRERFFLIAFPCGSFGERGILANVKYDIQIHQEWSSTKNIITGREWQRWLNKTSFNLDGVISKSDFCGMDDGLPEDLDRIGLIGNAIVPQVVIPIMQAIKEIDENIVMQNKGA